MQAAAEFGEVGVLHLLLDAGADPNRRGVFGATALRRAVAKAYPEMVAVLLQFGARVDIKDDVGDTVIDTEAYLEVTELIRVDPSNIMTVQGRQLASVFCYIGPAVKH